MSEKQLLLPLEPLPATANHEDGPEASLVKSVAALRELHHRFSRNPNTKMMIDLVYSDIAYALDPEQLIAVNVPAKVPVKAAR